VRMFGESSRRFSNMRLRGKGDEMQSKGENLFVLKKRRREVGGSIRTWKKGSEPRLFNELEGRALGERARRPYCEGSWIEKKEKAQLGGNSKRKKGEG